MHSGASAPPVLAALAFLTVGLAGCIQTPVPPPPAMAYRVDCAISPGAGGASWPEQCLALASPNDSPSKSEIDLAVNPTNPLNVVVASKDLDRSASDCVWSVAQVTKDGGKTWQTSYVGGDKTHRDALLAPYQCVTDPIMAFDSHGVLYYAQQAYEARSAAQQNLPAPPLPVASPVGSAGSAFILARSQDGGATWDKYNIMALGDGSLVYHDYPRMIVNPRTGSVSTIWNGAGGVGTVEGGPTIGRGSPIVSTTRDGGETVAPPVTFMAQDAPTNTAFFSGFAVAADGTVYVTVAKNSQADQGAPTDVWIWKSSDDAQTFTEVGKAFTINPAPRQHGNHQYRTASFTEMALDATSGAYKDRLYTFWPEFSNNQSDILSARSDDGGRTWSSPVNVATEAAGDQSFMRPRVGPDGVVHVIFASQAYSGNEMLDMVHAWSRDGGLTWDNQRLTNTSYDGDLGIHQSGFPFIGDYNGLGVASDGTVYAAWGDTVTGRAEIAFARILAG